MIFMLPFLKINSTSKITSCKIQHFSSMERFKPRKLKVHLQNVRFTILTQLKAIQKLITLENQSF